MAGKCKADDPNQGGGEICFVGALVPLCYSSLLELPLNPSTVGKQHLLFQPTPFKILWILNILQIHKTTYIEASSAKIAYPMVG